MTKWSRLSFFVLVVLLCITLFTPFSFAETNIVSLPTSNSFQPTILVAGFSSSTKLVSLSIILADPTSVQNPEFATNFNFTLFAQQFLSTIPTVSILSSGQQPLNIDVGPNWLVTDGQQELNLSLTVSTDQEIQIEFEFLLPTTVTVFLQEGTTAQDLAETYSWSSRYAFNNYPNPISYLHPSLIYKEGGQKGSTRAEFVFNFLPFDFNTRVCFYFQIPQFTSFPQNTEISIKPASLVNPFQVKQVQDFQAKVCLQLEPRQTIAISGPQILPSLTIAFVFPPPLSHPNFGSFSTKILQIDENDINLYSARSSTFGLEWMESVSPLINYFRPIPVELVEISPNLTQIANFFTSDTENTKKNWIRWSLRLQNTTSTIEELSYSFPYLSSMESIIVFCLAEEPGQVVATPTGPQKFSLEFFTSSVLLHCYGSVSPFDQYRDYTGPGFASPYIVDFKLGDVNSAQPNDYDNVLPLNSEEFANLKFEYKELPWFIDTSDNKQSIPKIFRQFQITFSGNGYFNSNQIEISFPEATKVAHMDNLGHVSLPFSTYKLSDYTNIVQGQIPVEQISSNLDCLITSHPSARYTDVIKCDLPIYHQMNPQLTVTFSIPIEDSFPSSFSFVKYLPYDSPRQSRTLLQFFKTSPIQVLIPQPIKPQMFYYPSSPTSRSGSLILSQQSDSTLPKLSNFLQVKTKLTPYINFNFLFDTTGPDVINENKIIVSLYYFDTLSSTPTLIPGGMGIPSPVSNNGVQVKLDLSSQIKSIQNKPLFAFIEYIYDDGANNSPLDPTSTYFVSELVTLIKTCAQPPLLTLPNDFSDASKWIASSCSNGGICDRSGQCICKDGFTGPTCDITPCSTCVHKASCTISPLFNNQPNAIPGGKCVCSSSWSGDMCNIPTLCSTVSSTQCLNNGTLTEITSSTPPTCDISKPCHCQDSWAPPKCANCQLSCKNRGVVKTNQCSICQCAAGFSGKICDCRGLDASFTINGYNEYIVQYLTALKDTPNSIPTNLLQSFESTLGSLLEVISDLLSVDFKSLFNFEPAITITPQSGSDPATTSTTFRFQIHFNCPDHNPDLTQDAIYNQFRTVLLTKFTSDPTVSNLFVFNVIGDNQPLNGDITPTKSTDIEDPNSENSSFSLSLWCSLLSIISVFMLFK